MGDQKSEPPGFRDYFTRGKAAPTTPMKAERILLPVDIRNCPLDVFPLVDRLAGKPAASLTLLSVVTLNILAPDSRVYGDLESAATSYLKRLCREYLPSVAVPVTRIRFGKVVDEILAEAQAKNTDFIVLPTHGPSLAQRWRAAWRKRSHPLLSRGVGRLMREAGCARFVAWSSVRFDCEREWGSSRAVPTEPAGASSGTSHANRIRCVPRTALFSL